MMKSPTPLSPASDFSPGHCSVLNSAGHFTGKKHESHGKWPEAGLGVRGWAAAGRARRRHLWRWDVRLDGQLVEDKGVQR